MKKAKKWVFAGIIIVIAYALVIVGLWFGSKAIVPKTYSSAKEKCEKVLNRYQIQMEEIALEALESDEDVSGKFKKYKYSCSKNEETVTFAIGAQGFRGAQYWDLIYTADGAVSDETESFLQEDPFDSNIFKGEKINDNWWFFWSDYYATELSYQ